MAKFVGNTGLTMIAAYIVQAQRYLLRSFLTRDWTPGALKRQLSTDFVIHQLLPAVTRPSSLIKGSPWLTPLMLHQRLPGIQQRRCDGRINCSMTSAATTPDVKHSSSLSLLRR